jgi:hypothetical protein
MTMIAQEFIQEGIEKGLEQGRLEAKREIARILLKQHDAVTVSEITVCPLRKCRHFKRNSLEFWGCRHHFPLPFYLGWIIMPGLTWMAKAT